MNGELILELKGLAVDCIIGDLPEERAREQRLVVDVALALDAAAAESDMLADTVDYAALAGRLRDALVQARCRMVERAAKVALDVCLSEGKVRHARVRVTKAGAVPGLDAASVTLEGGAA